MSFLKRFMYIIFTCADPGYAKFTKYKLSVLEKYKFSALVKYCLSELYSLVNMITNNINIEKRRMRYYMSNSDSTEQPLQHFGHRVLYWNDLTILMNTILQYVELFFSKSSILKVYGVHLTGRFKRKNYKWHANIHAHMKYYIGALRSVT
jgi:hypothetical protein